MNDKESLQSPTLLSQILSETVAAGFQMASEPLTGSLLRTLAASKPSGSFLELGTGTGISTAWLLDGMDGNTTLDSVDNDSHVAAIAQKYLGHDRRVAFHVEDASILIQCWVGQKRQFDLIFADAWVGKYALLEEILSLLKFGGLYIIDDMLPQTNWIEGHEFNVKALIKTLANRQDLTFSQLDWASGIIIATKQA